MLSTRTLAIGLLTLAAMAAACASSNKATDDGKVCTAGAYVYCRCEDRAEGTKLCQADGKGFDACKCDGSGGDDPGGGTNYDPNGPLEPTEAGAPTGGAVIEAACAQKLGVLYGSDAENDTYLATYKGDGGFTVSRGHPGLRSPVEIVEVGSTLVAAYRGTFDALLWSKLDGGTWSSPFQVGSATSAVPPSLTAQNGGARLFFLGSNGFHMATYGTSGWDDGSTLAGLAVDGGPSPSGNSPPASAVAGSSLTLAFASNDGTLTRNTFSSGQWSAPVKFTNAATFEAQPNVVGLEGSGTKDMLLVYTGSDLVLHFTARESSNKAWSTPAVVDTAASTGDSASEASLVALAGGKALLVYRGVDHRGYWTVWDVANGFSTPKTLGDATIASAPAVGRGHCGSDATIAYAKEDGGVELMRLAGTTMTGPFAISGAGKATYVGVGEIP